MLSNDPKHISSLAGIGRGQKCIIYGGGTSLDDFREPDGDYFRISCNQHRNHLANIIIYYDEIMKDYYNNNKVRDDQLLIGFKNNLLNNCAGHCTHFYTFNDIQYGDTGFHALQFADKIFQFSEIYLAGYDYYTKGDKYHHSQAPGGDTQRFILHSIGRVLHLYQLYKNQNIVYKCNPDSLLPYKFNLPDT
jgi:hypothetical protein